MELQELSVSGTNKRHGVDEQRSVGRSWAWAAECISSIGLQENALFGPNGARRTIWAERGLVNGPKLK